MRRTPPVAARHCPAETWRAKYVSTPVRSIPVELGPRGRQPVRGSSVPDLAAGTRDNQPQCLLGPSLLIVADPGVGETGQLSKLRRTSEGLVAGRSHSRR